MSIGVGYNAFWNVLGSTLPLLAGVVAIPLLLHGLGNTRLGIFTLALGLIGFSRKWLLPNRAKALLPGLLRD